MFDKRAVRALLGPVDPARQVAVPPPRTSAADVIAKAEAESVPVGHRVRTRRLLLIAAAATVAAAAGSAYTWKRNSPGPHEQAGTDTSDTHQDRPQPGLRLGPVVQPVALQYTTNPPAASERLRELADRVAPAPYDTTSGRYTYIHTVGWNAVFDDTPDGNTQVIRPDDKQIWYMANGSGRIKTTPLAPVYPNEASRRYWERRLGSTATPGAANVYVLDLPAGIGPRQPLPTDSADLAKRLGVDAVGQHGAQVVFSAVRDLYSMHVVPQQTRAQILRALATVSGIAWRGSVTDRADRTGMAISIDTKTLQQILIFDPLTGALLAYDEVERPNDTVAGAKLFLGADHTDHLG
ncbi:CU044_5270 family protein [Dactylosporangium sp. NPDC000555]|uniref:CU044_5270 family protein n=1 Tax=Dactylosporangium sp. NPDC000555 TaxID=3154260 RepID=UPI003328BB02